MPFRDFDWSKASLDECLDVMRVYNNEGRAERLEAIMTLQRAMSIINNIPNELAYEECIQFSSRIIGDIRDYIEFQNLHFGLKGHFENVPDVYSTISNFFILVVKESFRKSEDALIAPKYLLENDRQLLSRSIKECRKSWFKEHKIKTTKDGISRFVKVRGVSRAGHEELFDFITEELGDVFSDKQKVGMSDVFLASDYMSFKGAISFSDLPATTKVHIGRIHNYTNCSKERYVELCFDDELDKIPTSNKKDHKTPDYLSRKDDDHPDIAIEVYGTTQGELYQRCEGAVRHGDEKLIGWSEFTRQYCVDDDALKIAALVVDDYLLDNVDDNFLRRHISRIKVDGSQMDFLLIVFKDVASVSEIRAVIIALGDKEVPYNISERVEHWPHPYKIVSN